MNTQTESPTHLHGRELLNARLVWLLFALICILSALSIVFLALSWATPVPDTWGFRGDAMLLALAFGSIGLLLARRHPQNPIGWLLLLSGLINSILEFCVEYATYALLTTSGALTYGKLAAWTASWIWVASIGTLIYSFLLFPTGRLPSERWRPVAWFFVGAFGLLTFVFMIRPGPLYFAPYLDNPFTVQVADRVLSLIPVAAAAAIFLVGISVILRLRRAEGVERQQLKWFAYAATLRVIFGISESMAEGFGLKGTDPKVFQYLSVAIWIAIAVTIAFAILRYRLWDIDIIINRTLVYGALTASVAGLYVLIVGGLGALLQLQNNLPSIMIATLLIAFLFQPLRRRLQDRVNHFVPVPEVTIRESIPSPVPQTEQEQRVAVTGSAHHTALRGRWLILARLAWAVVFSVLTAMYTFGFLSVRDTLSMVCQEEQCTLRQQIQHTDAGDKVLNWPGPPVGYADRLRPDQVEALETLGLTLDQYGWLAALQMGIPALVLLLIGAGLFWWKSDDWMVLFSSLMVATFPLHNTPLPFDLMVHQPVWEWVYHLAGVVAFSCLMIFPLIFPNGQFVPRWTRWMALYGIAGAFMGAFLGSTILEVLGDFAGRAFIGFGLLLPSFGTGVFAQLYRYFRVARPAERQQIKWVVVWVVGFVVTQFAVLIPLNALLTSPAMSTDPTRALVLSAIPDTLWQINLLLIPVCITISILRYRLWDIDIIINRTLVYGALTGIIVSAFVVIVGLISTIFQSRGNSIIAIIATGLVALLFNPLRQRLQRGVNHLMYGERDEPYAALSRLGRQLEASLAPESVLPTVVTTVRDVLRLPYVAIYLQQESHGYKIVAESASPLLRMENGRIRVPGMEREGRCIPLIHQGETVGYIVLGPRATNEAFGANDLRLLDDLAPQVGVAVHAVRLTTDLQRSREQLVLAREEERRRVRRDLHDGLGPQLAGLALKLETLRNRLKDDPLADSLLADLAKQTQDATADIRHLVYELRPPTLDELGLASALRESVAQFTQQGCNNLNITFGAPENLPPLPAAVEVAVYRITQEAVLNVMRHADAHNCHVHLSLDESAGLLCLEVQDDGKGFLLKRRAGIGLNSMRERAEELGGTFTITPVPTGGTLLTARFPCRVNGPARPTDQNALEASNKEV